jgi:hypothetical protein
MSQNIEPSKITLIAFKHLAVLADKPVPIRCLKPNARGNSVEPHRLTPTQSPISDPRGIGNRSIGRLNESLP